MKTRRMDDEQLEPLSTRTTFKKTSPFLQPSLPPLMHRDHDGDDGRDHNNGQQEKESSQSLEHLLISSPVDNNDPVHSQSRLRQQPFLECKLFLLIKLMFYIIGLTWINHLSQDEWFPCRIPITTKRKRRRRRPWWLSLLFTFVCLCLMLDYKTSLPLLFASASIHENHHHHRHSHQLAFNDENNHQHSHHHSHSHKLLHNQLLKENDHANPDDQSDQAIDGDYKEIDGESIGKPAFVQATWDDQQFRPERATPFTASDPLLIKTTKGFVRGVTQTTPTGKTVDAFLGIPYAMPPVGKYRFRHPKPVDPWPGVFNASTRPNSCYQVSDTFFGEDFRGSNMWNRNTPMSEDCLKINVWVPRPRPTHRLRPVLVWIFGGGFYYGSSTLDLYDGRVLASEENILIVSMNYRVSSLGFLYLDRKDAPGNAALFDQLMALEWIRDNIAFFGGNPENVTLFGESSGAVSISFHLLSPLSRNLFSQAVLQSGGPTCPWALFDRNEAITRALNLAASVGCPSSPDDLDPVIECLRKVDPYDLVHNVTGEFGVVDFPFVPVVDGSFLDEAPEVSLQTKNFKKTKLLLGSDREEGHFFIIYHLIDMFKKNEDVYISREDFVRIVQELHPYMSKLGHEAILHEYTDWLDPNDPIKLRDAVDKMVGDFYFTCHVNEIAHRYAAAGNDVYMYYFVHRSTYSAWPKWMGVIHGDEIPFIFGEPLEPKYGYTPAEIDLSRRMMKFWANFAKTGNPSKTEDDKWTEYWPLHTEHGKEYLTLSTNGTTFGRGPRARQCAFWQKYLPTLVKDASSRDRPCNLTPSDSDGGISTGLQITLIIFLIGVISLLLFMSFYAFKWRTAAMSGGASGVASVPATGGGGGISLSGSRQQQQPTNT